MIVEVVGPSGAGKSSLAGSLCARHRELEPSERLRLGDWRHASFVAVQLLRVLPLLIPRLLAQPRLDRTQLKQLLYLNGWDRTLRRQEQRAGRSLVIDQGPVFYLAMLHGFIPGQEAGEHFERWWRGRVARWASVLDGVILVDADDDVLLARIAKRDKHHPLENQGPSDAADYLARYRSSLEAVIAGLCSHREIPVVRLDTAGGDAEAATSRAWQELASHAG